MKYKINVPVVGHYTVYVEAKDKDTAKEIASDAFLKVSADWKETKEESDMKPVSSEEYVMLKASVDIFVKKSQLSKIHPQ